MVMKKTKKKPASRNIKKTTKKVAVKEAPKKKDRGLEDLVKIKDLPRSTLVNEDLERIEMKYSLPDSSAHGGEIPAYYKKYVLKCTKCIRDFEHTVHIPVIRQRIGCPVCGETHILEITPVSGEYMIRFSEGVEVMDRGGRKKSKTKR